MKRIRYIGTASVRRVSKEDFEAAGVTDQDAIEINRRQDPTVEVSDDAAKFLAEGADNFAYADQEVEVGDDPTPEEEAGAALANADVAKEKDKAQQAKDSDSDTASASVPAEGDQGTGSPKSTKGSARS